MGRREELKGDFSCRCGLGTAEFEGHRDWFRGLRAGTMGCRIIPFLQLQPLCCCYPSCWASHGLYYLVEISLVQTLYFSEDLSLSRRRDVDVDFQILILISHAGFLFTYKDAVEKLFFTLNIVVFRKVVVGMVGKELQRLSNEGDEADKADEIEGTGWLGCTLYF